jgi:CRISPR-associated protein Cas5t
MIHRGTAIDCSEENVGLPTLEQRAREALMYPENINRFGGLCLGESTHLVDEVRLFEGDSTQEGTTFLLHDRGRLSLPIWVDHVGSEGTRYVIGELKPLPLLPPEIHRLPKIEPSTPTSKPSRRKKSNG